MSESLPVELNRETVHSIDAPESFTAHGPFHVELSNAGGAVHVHVHLDDDLSRGARIEGVNHYVEGGETVRVPVGTVPGGDTVTGELEIVSGYGTERERVEITIDAEARDPEGDEVRQPSDRAPAEKSGIGPTSRNEDAPRTVRAPSNRGSRDHPMGGSPSGMGARGLLARSLPDLPTSLGSVSREGLAFVGLAAVATAVGLTIILTVRDLLVAAVVAAIVTAAVAVVGWLLFE